VQLTLKSVDDLRGHALLYLQTSGVALDESSQLRKPGNSPVRSGKVRHVREPREGDEVMFTQGGEGNIAHENHFVVARLERDPKVSARVFVGAVEELDVHVGHATGRLTKSVTVGIVTDGFEKFRDQRGDAVAVNHA
jgi:hypothetical protein